uniref:Putative diacetyl reductase/l-xylulose reductase n=1 Tax=Amblyomma aureolatum TaxID=187763 RepID=A0A1E1XEQ6_9ACAR
METFFSGKRAVVTGAAQGMGARIATDLAKYGATVIAVDLLAAKLAELQKQVPNIIPVAVDLSDWDATQRALADVGDVDLLVNNAGITKLDAFGDIDQATVDKIFAVNFKATLNVSQICVQSMKSRGVPGAVVNISSQSGLVALPEHAVYCGSKAAVDMLTKVMALELGPYNIRVNSVNPTVTNTAMGAAVWEQEPGKAAAMKAKIPLGRFAETREISDVVLFLLSDMSSMVTGVILPIDGGYTAV